MLKWILFQAHWLIGISAGLVLALVGLTGSLLSFEDEIVHAWNPSIYARPTGTEPALTPEQLVTAVRTGTPNARIQSVSVSAEGSGPAVVGLAPAEGQGRGRQVLVDPRTGAELGEPAGRGFFQFNEQLHRWLVLPGGNQGIGKTIVGISTLLLVFLALSGLYLRWPKQFLNWRSWFVIKWRRRGVPFWWNLHAVLGVYVFLAYLVMALTGLWWSFDWYKNGLSLALTGKPATQQGPGGPTGGAGDGQQPAEPAPDVALGPVWDGFLTATGGAYETATITLPRKLGDPVQVRFLAAGAGHERAFDQMKLDAATGAVIGWDKFAEKAAGERLYGSVFPLHSGSYFGIIGRVLWMLASVLMPVFFVSGWILYLGRRKHRRIARSRAGMLAAAPAE